MDFVPMPQWRAGNFSLRWILRMKLIVILYLDICLYFRLASFSISACCRRIQTKNKKTTQKARPPVALDVGVGRGHPAARIAAPLPTSSSPPTPSSLRSASTASSSTQSSPQQQQVQHQHHSQSSSVASAATAALTNGTSPSASASTGGGGAPPPSRQSEPKDLKYRETTPSAKKKVTRLASHARTLTPKARNHPLHLPPDPFLVIFLFLFLFLFLFVRPSVRYGSRHVMCPGRQFTTLHARLPPASFSLCIYLTQSTLIQ